MKNLKKLLAVLTMSAMVVGLCACGGNTETPSTDKESESSQPATPGDKDTEKDTADDSKVTYTVKVVDADGNPVSGIMVQWCLESCFPAMTDDKGVATYTAEAGDYKVSVTTQPEKEYHYENGATELTITMADEK